jgi:hypothetical protein
MGKYDDISPDRIRSDLVQFASWILRLDAEDALLRSPADLQRVLGDLRQKIFAYEVRSSRFVTKAVEPPGEGTVAAREEEDALVRLSLRVVREALRRSEEMEREWEGAPPDEDEGHD